MTKQEVLDLINQYIVANGVQAITGPVLNGVLIPMVNQINDLVGALEDLNTSDTSSIVNAINSIQLESISVTSGTEDPNVTPPALYSIGDFYIQLDGLGEAIGLFIYTGVAGFGWVNLASSNGVLDITVAPSINKEGTAENPLLWANDFNLLMDPSGEKGDIEWEVDGSGQVTQETAELYGPNNLYMLKFDMGAGDTASAEFGLNPEYEGQKIIFKGWVKSDEDIVIGVHIDEQEIATQTITGSNEWQQFSIPLTVPELTIGKCEVVIDNANAAVYFLDMMYVGVDVFQKLPYIPLAGTEAGNPVTGHIELGLLSKIFNTDGVWEAGLGAKIIDGLHALYLYYEYLSGDNKRGIGIDNAGVWIADEQGYGLIGSSYFSHSLATSFVQRKYVDDRLPKLIVFANTQSITSTTETDITESVIAVEANSVYEIEINFRVGCSGANGMQFGFKMPAECTLMRSISGRTTGAGAQNISTNEHTGDTGLINMTVCSAVTEFGNFTGRLLLKVGSTAGNFIVTYGCLSGSQTSSVFANSYIKYTKFI